ncbi:MAG: hypothetical protein CSA45_01665 [Gammaproteobacteria bacterium]|nr:MAG: hypothetical protein CSA45_01665 [Gammaproteobacteria bacterium]
MLRVLLIKVLSGVVLVSGLLSVPVGAQNIPILGGVSDRLWGKKEELDIGREIYEKLEQQGNIHDDLADQDYLNYLGHKIGHYTNTRLGLRFYITKAKSINAFASPAGYVAINAGLILATDNEHELAGVLAHEIAHVSQEHIARTVLAAQDRRVGNAAAMIAAVLMATAGDSTDAGAGMVSAIVAGETQQQINDIRRHEKEADRIGRQLMKKAGFNELGMQSFFGKLYSSERAQNTPAYLLTHPLPLERQADIDSVGRQKANKYLPSSDEYFLFKARIGAGLLSRQDINRLTVQDKQSGQSQIRDAAHYLSALQHMRYGRFSQALGELSQMLSSMKRKRDVLLLQAKLHLLNKQTALAEKDYRSLWQRYRGDSIVAYDYARYLLSKNRLNQAVKLFENELDSVLLSDQQAHLYGQILGRLGRFVEQDKMLIRLYEQKGDDEKALTQAQIALSRPGLDWQSRSVFESKVKSLKSRIERAEND